MLHRVEPHDNYHGLPCSIVAVGCALGYDDYEDIRRLRPKGIYDNGYLPLEAGNRFIRAVLPVSKRVYYKRGMRPKLCDVLLNNKRRAVICCYGHLIYAEGDTYYSFFDNDNDDVVSIWWLNA